MAAFKVQGSGALQPCVDDVYYNQHIVQTIGSIYTDVGVVRPTVLNWPT